MAEWRTHMGRLQAQFFRVFKSSVYLVNINIWFLASHMLSPFSRQKFRVKILLIKQWNAEAFLNCKQCLHDIYCKYIAIIAAKLLYSYSYMVAHCQDISQCQQNIILGVNIIFQGGWKKHCWQFSQLKRYSWKYFCIFSSNPSQKILMVTPHESLLCHYFPNGLYCIYLNYVYRRSWGRILAHQSPAFHRCRYLYKAPQAQSQDPPSSSPQPPQFQF